MKGFVGVDIGTTNLKLLVLDENGKLSLLRSEKTPKYWKGTDEFFDLKGIDNLVDALLEEAKGIYEIKSLCFSSVGESVVPVLDGKALMDPPLWNCRRITSNEEERAVIRRYCDYSTTGMNPNGLLSLDKILWLRRNEEICRKAEAWLPITSYEVYRKTGKALWDYSQASRSYLFDISARAWIGDLLEEFGLDEPGRLCPMGTPVEGKDGILYAVGGHDHMVGLYGIETLFSPERKAPVLYDSLGTSSVLTMLTGNKGLTCSLGDTYYPNGAHVLPGFIDNAWILTRSFRRFGALMAEILTLGGEKYAENGFKTINREIDGIEDKASVTLFSVDGDYLQGNTGAGISLYELKTASGIPGLMHSLYIYLSILTRLMRDDLLTLIPDAEDIPFIAGGGITHDRFFLSYMASALEEPVFLLPTEETCAFGAALAGIVAYGEESVLASLQELRTQVKTVPPNGSLSKVMRDVREDYLDLKEKLKKNV